MNHVGDIFIRIIVLFFSLKTFKKENSDTISEKRQKDNESIPDNKYQVYI